MKKTVLIENHHLVINKIEIMQKILWIQGAPATEITSLSSFLAKINLDAAMYEMNNAMSIMAANDAVLAMLRGDENAPRNIIIFSQQRPPTVLEGQPFTPIHIKLSI